ncbi:unnamed protein product [Sphagnum balticum]
MLVDDNKYDNIYHERVIRSGHYANTIVWKETAEQGLDYLTHSIEKGDVRPDIIFLDINMPGMNGWEFLEEYEKLPRELQSSMIVVMLTTSDSPEDRKRASLIPGLKEFRTKPLTTDILDEIIAKYFSQQ